MNAVITSQENIQIHNNTIQMSNDSIEKSALNLSNTLRLHLQGRTQIPLTFFKGTLTGPKEPYFLRPTVGGFRQI